jgi:hypothetical protein
MTDQHLPATAAPVPAEPLLLDEVAAEPQRPLRVALLPLALVTFVILAFVLAAWTFLAAAT